MSRSKSLATNSKEKGLLLLQKGKCI